MALQGYRTVIICDADGDGKDEYYEADLIDPVNEHLSTEISQHPLVDGTTLADHEIIQPMTLNMTGSFSLNGYRGTEFEGSGERLANIQQLFEGVQKNGIFCKVAVLYKSTTGYDEGKIRFTMRENMILNSIDWVKNLNSLDFTFGFTECLTATITGVEYEKDVRDPLLPDLTEGQTLDFTENYLDFTQIDGMVIKMMKDCDLLTDEFLEKCITCNNTISTISLVAAVGAALALGLTVKAAVAGTLAVSAAVFPVGTIIVGIAGVGLLLAGIFKRFNEDAKRKKYKIAQFKAYKSDRENQAEIARFTNFLGQIHIQLEKLEDVMKVYGISANTAQECLLYIDDNYYSFNFTRNNSSNKWGLNVVDVNEEPIAEMAQIAGLSSLSECTSSNALFRTQGTGSYVYLMCPKQEELATNGASNSEIETAQEDLRNYQILVSSIKMENYNQLLEEIIKNALEA